MNRKKAKGNGRRGKRWTKTKRRNKTKVATTGKKAE